MVFRQSGRSDCRGLNSLDESDECRDPTGPSSHCPPYPHIAHTCNGSTYPTSIRQSFEMLVSVTRETGRSVVENLCHRSMFAPCYPLTSAESRATLYSRNATARALLPDRSSLLLRPNDITLTQPRLVFLLQEFFFDLVVSRCLFPAFVVWSCAQGF